MERFGGGGRGGLPDLFGGLSGRGLPEEECVGLRGWGIPQEVSGGVSAIGGGVDIAQQNKIWIGRD